VASADAAIKPLCTLAARALVDAEDANAPATAWSRNDHDLGRLWAQFSIAGETAEDGMGPEAVEAMLAEG
jgi:hypothetical protein